MAGGHRRYSRIWIVGSVALSLILLVCLPPPSTAAAQAVRDSLAERVEWLREHGVPLRTIHASESDFSDLAPVGEALGDARIVLLGEQHHADGATFVLKDRLVRFLHRDLGFGVLAFEAHHELLRLADARAAAGASIDSIGDLFPGMWGGSVYVRELLRYVRASHGKPSPLRLAGFDVLLGRRPENLEATRRALRELHHELSAAIPALDYGDAWLQVESILRPDGILTRDPDDIGEEAFLAALEAVRLLEHRVSAVQSAPESEVGRSLQQLIRNIGWALRDLEAERRGDERWTAVRDEAMAENLVWLAERAFPDERIVGWAHAGHVAKRLGDVEVLDGSFSWEAEVPMGEHLNARFGPEVYVIGFLAYQGEYGQVFADTAFLTKLREPPRGSLDWLLGQVGEPYLFLDLRAVPPDHWLRRQITARPVYRDMRAVWPEVFDGILFTRRMFPNRRVTSLTAPRG